jgi:hypothetical protein
MACNLIRDNKGNITNVFLDTGEESILFAMIDKIVENKEASYAVYLDIQNQSESGDLGFAPMNEQGQPNPFMNPKVMQMITAAAVDPGMYADKTKQLHHNHKKSLLEESLNNFLASINVSTQIVENIHDKNGNKLSVLGKARLMQRMIEVANGADVTTLSEEAAHFTTELLRADMNPLYNSMYGLIENYAEFQEMLDPNNFYFKQYGGDIDMLKREAIGKVISKHILGNDIQADFIEQSPEKVSRLQRWWDKVMNMIRKLFGRQGNPFVKAAEVTINSRIQEVLRTDPNLIQLPDVEFFEAEDGKITPYDKVMADQEKYAQKEVDVKDNPNWEFLSEDAALKIVRYYNIETGEVIENRMSDASSRLYKKNGKEFYGYTEEQEAYFKMQSKLRTDAGDRVHGVMEELVNYHTGQSKITPAQLQNKYTEYGPSHFKTLNDYSKYLVNEIRGIQKGIDPKGEVKIRTELMIINKATDAGGTLDLVAFFSDGSALIYDYKSKIPRLDKAGARLDKAGRVILSKDLWLSSEETYNLQMGQYKTTLLDQYGVTKVRRSRVLPILIQFKKNKNGVPMNQVQDLQVETGESPYLQQLPLALEATGIEKVDALIEAEERRLKLLLNDQKKASYAEKRRIQGKVDSSRRIIRDLRIDQSAESAISESWKTAKQTLEALKEDSATLEDGSINPKYMNNEELLNAYRDLMHFRNYTTLDEIVNELPEGNRKKALVAALKETKALIDSALLGSNSIKEKMMERLKDAAHKQGIKGIDSFNRSIGKLTGDWVSRSNQSHPALRLIHKTKSSIEANLVRVEKELANEIEEKVKALEAKFGTGAQIYDKLINPKTMNLWAKFNLRFKEDRKNAYEEQDIKWVKQYYEVDKELFDKEYANWKSNQVKLLREDNVPLKEANRRLARWEKRFNPKHDTAWLNPSNPFIKVTKDSDKLSKYLSEEYMEIMNTPELRDFYEFHIKMTTKFLRIMGADKGYNFIANVQKDMVDQMLEGDWSLGGMKASFLDMFQVNEHDIQFGVEDMDGNFLRHVPRFGLAELYKNDENGRKVRDVSLKSRELGKSLYLLGKSAYMYQYLSEAAPTMLLMETMYNMEGGIRELKEDKSGSLVNNMLGDSIKILNKTNINTITEYINAEFFGRSLTTQDSVSESGISMNKSILGLKNFHTISNLGLKGPVAIGALGSGFVGLEIQASKGMYITRPNLRKAQAAYFGRDPKLRAMFEYFEITLEDMSKRRGDLLSSNAKDKFMTTDRWFEFLARADRTLDAIAMGAMAMNYGIDPQTGKLELLDDLPEGTKSLWDTIEFEENPNYSGTGVGEKYITRVPGAENLEGDNNNWISFQQKVHRVGSKVKGAVPKHDSFNSQTKLINRMFIHYRSWLPGLAFERFGRLRYDYVMENFDQGTWKSLWGNIGPEKSFDSFGRVLDTELAMHDYTTAALKDVAKIALDVVTFGLSDQYKIKEANARLEFEKFLKEQQDNPEFQFETKEEKDKAFDKFIKMKRGNIKGALTELRAVLALIALMMAMGGDWDDDGKKDLHQSWTGRKLSSIVNRIYREVAVFADPRELAGPRSSGIPLLSFAQNGLKLLSNSADTMRDTFFGQDSNRDRTPAGYYTFKFVPGIHGIVQMAEIYPQDKIVK